jgi:hypothetical protein
VKCFTDFEIAQARRNVIFTAYPSDVESELSDSVVEVKLGNRGVHVVVSNPTNFPLTLEKRTILGCVESVAAMVPVLPAEIPKEEAVSQQHSQVNSVEVCEDAGGVLAGLDISYLSDDKRKVAEEMLWEERGVFCLSKEDHGDCPDLQMELKLTDNVPVVVPHRQIPGPLYEEVKNFLNDLIANNWVRESKSHYSSPIVCVRKRMADCVFVSTTAC